MKHVGSCTFLGSLLCVVAGCTISDGDGSAAGNLNLPTCWSGSYDLAPDFFTASPYQENSLSIRIQAGGDFQAFSDGMSIQVEDIATIRETLLGQPLKVDLPPAVVPPGEPVLPNPDPARVGASLYLQKTCRTLNVALYATRVQLSPSGACNDDEPRICSVPTSGPVGESTITFTHLYSGKIDESRADDRLIEGSYHLFFSDPRTLCPGVLAPPKCLAELKGTFRFYFQRGRPGQAFP